MVRCLLPYRQAVTVSVAVPFSPPPSNCMFSINYSLTAQLTQVGGTSHQKSKSMFKDLIEVVLNNFEILQFSAAYANLSVVSQNSLKD